MIAAVLFVMFLGVLGGVAIIWGKPILQILENKRVASELEVEAAAERLAAAQQIAKDSVFESTTYSYTTPGFSDIFKWIDDYDSSKFSLDPATLVSTCFTCKQKNRVKHKPGVIVRCGGCGLPMFKWRGKEKLVL